jgi:hypothetical protein
MIVHEPVAVLPFTLEQLQAISDSLHGRTQVRYNPDQTWTGEKLLSLMTVIDAELALLKAEAPNVRKAIEEVPQK